MSDVFVLAKNCGGANTVWAIPNIQSQMWFGACAVSRTVSTVTIRRHRYHSQMKARLHTISLILCWMHAIHRFPESRLQKIGIWFNMSLSCRWIQRYWAQKKKEIQRLPSIHCERVNATWWQKPFLLLVLHVAERHSLDLVWTSSCMCVCAYCLSIVSRITNKMTFQWNFVNNIFLLSFSKVVIQPSSEKSSHLFSISRIVNRIVWETDGRTGIWEK